MKLQDLPLRLLVVRHNAAARTELAELANSARSRRFGLVVSKAAGAR